MKYKKLTGIVLKKQNYREADQMLTVFSKEAGKVRCLARGLRRPQSKLAFSVQDLALVEIETVNSKISTLISAKALDQFVGIRKSLPKTASAFFASELVIKATPDEHPDKAVFDLLLDYFNFLEQEQQGSDISAYAFALKFMASIGFSIEKAEESFRIPPQLLFQLQQMRTQSFQELAGLDQDAPAAKLKNLVRDFIHFVLERNLKSESFLKVTYI